MHQVNQLKFKLSSCKKSNSQVYKDLITQVKYLTDLGNICVIFKDGDKDIIALDFMNPDVDMDAVTP